MENQPPKTGKFALKYGIILGAVGIVFSLMLFFLDVHYQIDLKRMLTMALIGLLFIVVGSIFAIRDFKKNNEGFVSTSQGLKIGVGMALVSAVISILFNFILSEVIDPDMKMKTAEYMKVWMADMGVPDDKIEEEVNKVKNPNHIQNVGFALIFNIIFGFIGSLAPALILRKSKPDY